jgi:hypothetical protein
MSWGIAFRHGLGELCDTTGRPRVVLPVRRWEDYLELGVAESFPTDADRTLAGESDRQGIGGPARVRPRSG